MIRTILLATLALAFVLTGARAQEDQGDPLPKAKLEQADVEKFEKLLNTALDEGDVASKRALVEAMEAYEKEKKVGSVLADVDAWQGMYKRRYQNSLEKKRGGSVKVEQIKMQINGKPVIFEYAYYLPRGYSHDKPWPIILCFHDEVKKGKAQNAGKTYIQKVWQGNKECKALAEEFILVAPSIGEKTMKGKVGKQKVDPIRFKWFDSVHARAMILPLIEMRKKFNIDPQRIYVEGVGQGGEIALELGALYGVETFAAVVARHAQPRNLQLLPGLRHVPTMFLYRDGGPFDEGGKKELWADIKASAERDELKQLTYKNVAAVAKVSSKTLAGQKTDPMWDADKDVAEFFKAQVLPEYPSAVQITTNNRSFVLRSPIMLTQHDLDEDVIVNCEMEVDKDKNAINVHGDRFHAFVLFLNDKVVDLDRPVEVYVNGILAKRETVVRDVNYMLKNMRSGYRTDRLYTCTMKVTVPEPVEDKGGEAAGESGAGATDGK